MIKPTKSRNQEETVSASYNGKNILLRERNKFNYRQKYGVIKNVRFVNEKYIYISALIIEKRTKRESRVIKTENIQRSEKINKMIT